MWKGCARKSNGVLLCFSRFSRLLAAVGNWVNPPFKSIITNFLIYSHIFFTVDFIHKVSFFFGDFFSTKFFALFMKFDQKTQTENFNETLLYVIFFFSPMMLHLSNVARGFFFFLLTSAKRFSKQKFFLRGKKKKKKKCDNNKRLLTDCLMFPVRRCRRSLMAVHFDEVWDDAGCQRMCDTCRRAPGLAARCFFHRAIRLFHIQTRPAHSSFSLPPLPFPRLVTPPPLRAHAADVKAQDISEEARQVIQIVEVASSQEEKVTPLKLLDTWLGKGPAKRRKMIKTTGLSRMQAEQVIVHLLLQDYLRCLRFTRLRVGL